MILALMVVGCIVFLLAVAAYVEREKVGAWWARVSNTEGGKQIIKEANDVEEWIKRNRGHHIPPYPLPPRPSEPSLAAAAPIAAADPPAAEPPALPGTAAPAMAIAAPSTVRETPPLPRETTMDTGVVSAGQLLAGWILPDYEAVPPVEGAHAKRLADIMYLTQTVSKPGGNNVFEDVLLGSQGAVNVVKNYCHTMGVEGQINYKRQEDGSYVYFDRSTDPAVSPEVKAAAEASVKAFLALHPTNPREHVRSALYGTGQTGSMRR